MNKLPSPKRTIGTIMNHFKYVLCYGINSVVETSPSTGTFMNHIRNHPSRSLLKTGYRFLDTAGVM